MESPGLIALSRLDVLRRQMDVVAHNIANVNTPAFKAEHLMFVEYQADTGDRDAGDLRMIRLVQDIATVRDLAEGPLEPTGNPLDLAINGDGYFVVRTEQGERYTRQGSFMLDGEGTIVTSRGQPLIGDRDAPIVLPPGVSEVMIARDGTISTRDPDNPALQMPLGRLRIVTFEDDHRLRREASGLMRTAPNMPPEVVANPAVLQGMIEQSNVSGVLEMTKLIDTMHSYQAANRMVEEEHERQRRAIQILGTPAAQA